MTAPEASGLDSPIGSHDLETLLDLATTLTARIVTLSRAAPARSGSPELQAFERLVAGIGHTSDELLLRVTVSGARLLVVQFDSRDSAVRVTTSLRSDASCLVALRPAGEVVVLVPNVPRQADQPDCRRAAERHAVRVTRLAGKTAVGLSSPLRGVWDVAAAYQEARDCALLAVERGETMLFAEDAWVTLAIRRLASELSQGLTLGNPLRRVLEHDHRSGLDLAGTLRVWLEESGDIARAAPRLGLHVNSLRYRLRRISDLCSLDLDDPEVRILAYLMLVRGKS